MAKDRIGSSDRFTREKLESVLFRLSRNLMAVDVIVRRILSKTEGGITDGRAMRFIVNLLSNNVEEIIAISKLRNSPLGEITPASLKEHDALAFQDFLNSDAQTGPESALTPLSMREREVVKCLAEGKSNKEIATLLGLSVNTVETYRARIMMKLNAHSLSDLFRFAVRHKLVEIPSL